MAGLGNKPVPNMNLLPDEGKAIIQWQEANRQTGMALNWMEAHALFEGTLHFRWKDKGHTQ